MTNYLSIEDVLSAVPDELSLPERIDSICFRYKGIEFAAYDEEAARMTQEQLREAMLALEPFTVLQSWQAPKGVSSTAWAEVPRMAARAFDQMSILSNAVSNPVDAHVGHKDTVRERFPKAYCSGGNPEPHPWLIYRDNSNFTEVDVIGRGRSGAAAWSDAAKSLRVAVDDSPEP